MEQILRRAIENGFAEFQGLSITGTIPISDTLINEVLAEWLRTKSVAEPIAPSRIDPKNLLQLIKKAEVHANEGKLVLDFELRA
jgi:hypothetical protein